MSHGLLQESTDRDKGFVPRAAVEDLEIDLDGDDL